MKTPRWSEGRLTVLEFSGASRANARLASAATKGWATGCAKLTPTSHHAGFERRGRRPPPCLERDGEGATRRAEATRGDRQPPRGSDAILHTCAGRKPGAPPAAKVTGAMQPPPATVVPEDAPRRRSGAERSSTPASDDASRSRSAAKCRTRSPVMTSVTVSLPGEHGALRIGLDPSGSRSETTSSSFRFLAMETHHRHSRQMAPNGNGVQRPHPGERPGVVRCNDGLGVSSQSAADASLILATRKLENARICQQPASSRRSRREWAFGLRIA